MKHDPRRGPREPIAALRLVHAPIIDGPNVAWWLVNGFRASVQVWSPSAWGMLADPKPGDAQRLADGSWVALRIA